MELEEKGEPLHGEASRALNSEGSEEESETKENGVQNQLFQNSKEKQKQIKNQILCIPVRSVKNQNTGRDEEINEQEN